jgi:hypothetical protein
MYATPDTKSSFSYIMSQIQDGSSSHVVLIRVADGWDRHVAAGASGAALPKINSQLTYKPGSVGPVPCGMDVAAIHL